MPTRNNLDDGPEPVLPPVFPCLYLSPGILAPECVALMPRDFRSLYPIVGRKPLLTLLTRAREIPLGPPAWNEPRDNGRMRPLETAAAEVARRLGNRSFLLLPYPGPVIDVCADEDGTVDVKVLDPEVALVGDHFVDYDRASCLGDPPGVRRRWKLSEPVLQLDVIGDGPASSGYTRTYRLPDSWWVVDGDYGNIGHRKDFREALDDAHMTLPMSLPFEVWTSPDLADHADIRACLKILTSETGEGVFNGDLLCLNGQGLLFKASKEFRNNFSHPLTEGLTLDPESILDLPCGLRVVIDDRAPFRFERQPMRPPAGHYWREIPEPTIPRPYRPDLPLRMSFEAIAAPRTIEDALAHCRLLYLDPDGTPFWKGEWAHEFPLFDQLSDKDIQAWRNWLKTDATVDLLEQLIERCRSLALRAMFDPVAAPEPER